MQSQSKPEFNIMDVVHKIFSNNSPDKEEDLFETKDYQEFNKAELNLKAVEAKLDNIFNP